MSKQTHPIRHKCALKKCKRAAVIGIYHWNPGETDVDLNQPVAVVCGPHKPRWTSPNQLMRNVRLVR